MKTILRVGITVGGLAFVTLFALQAAVALAVATGITIAGICAGLGAAKWLERPWYGRQLAAGLRTGAIAVGMSGAGVLLALFTQGPHSVALLAARSHLFLVDARPLIGGLSGLGWEGIDILVVLLAMLAGIVLAMFSAQAGAWSKNLHAIQVVAQARLAARGAAPAADERASISGLFGVPDSAPVVAAMPPLATVAASTRGNNGWIPAGSERFPSGEPTMPVPPPHPQAKARPDSKARPADSQLTQAMREALATWASDSTLTNDAGGAETPPPRARMPQPSNYLNSSPPTAGKRARKKSNTEWIR